MVDKPPTQDAIMQAGVRKWETPEHRPNMTLTRAAYKPYSTLVPPSTSLTAHRTLRLIFSNIQCKTEILRLGTSCCSPVMERARRTSLAVGSLSVFYKMPVRLAAKALFAQICI